MKPDLNQSSLGLVGSYYLEFWNLKRWKLH